MKTTTNIKIISLFLMLSIGVYITPQKASAQGVTVSYQVFYDELSPYGTWVDMSNYGYVWVPDVAPGFTPYSTNGYWVYTDMGWTWVSYYPWGWAPFHYGRWYTNTSYGPVWIPDNVWGPGWVTWRRSEGYYGWAPIGPGGYYNVPYNQWTFVSSSYLGRTDINNYYVNSSNNITIINNTTVINNYRKDNTRNTTYNAGPSIADVEKRSGKKITPITIKESSKPGQNLSNNQLQIYKPQVKKTNATGPKSAPAKVVGLRDVKTIEQRKNTSGNPTQKAIQPNNQKQTKTQSKEQPSKQQPTKTQATGKPTQKKQTQTQPNGQPNQQKQTQTQPNRQPTQQKQTQTQPNGQPNQQKQKQTQPNRQTNKQKPAQQQAKPNQNKGGEKPSQ